MGKAGGDDTERTSPRRPVESVDPHLNHNVGVLKPCKQCGRLRGFERRLQIVAQRGGALVVLAGRAEKTNAPVVYYATGAMIFAKGLFLWRRYCSTRICLFLR